MHGGSANAGAALTVNAAPPTTGGHHGGGAVGVWALAALALLGLVGYRRRFGGGPLAQGQ